METSFITKSRLVALGIALICIFIAWKVGYDSGFMNAKSLAEDSRFGDLFRTPDDIRFLVGVVTAVDDTGILLTTEPHNPFDASLRERRIRIDAATQMNVKIADIKIGDTLLVTAATDIGSLKEFTAQLIQIQPSSEESFTVRVDEE